MCIFFFHRSPCLSLAVFCAVYGHTYGTEFILLHSLARSLARSFRQLQLNNDDVIIIIIIIIIIRTRIYTYIWRIDIYNIILVGSSGGGTSHSLSLLHFISRTYLFIYIILYIRRSAYSVFSLLIFCSVYDCVCVSCFYFSLSRVFVSFLRLPTSISLSNSEY